MRTPRLKSAGGEGGGDVDQVVARADEHAAGVGDAGLLKHGRLAAIADNAADTGRQRGRVDLGVDNDGREAGGGAADLLSTRRPTRPRPQTITGRCTMPPPLQ